MSDPAILRLINISFSSQEGSVLKGINFSLHRGEIHAIVGEHLSGKSLLVDVIAGRVVPDSGSLWIKGRLYEKLTPKEAIQAGIGVIYQEPMTIPNLSVWENISTGRTPMKRLNTKGCLFMINRCREAMNTLGITLDLDASLSSLTEKERQFIEIIRLVYQDNDIIVLDDLGSRLTTGDMKRVIRFLKKEKEKGKAILFIDSNVDNVMEIADRVTFLSHGSGRGTERADRLDRLKLLRLAYNFTMNLKDERVGPKEFPSLDGIDEAVIAHMPTGVMILNNEGMIKMVNSMAEKIFGQPKSYLTGHALGQVLFTESTEIAQQILSSLSLREMRIWESLPYKGNKALKLKTIPLEEHGAVVLIEDITEDNAMTEYLMRADKISSIAELASGVAHEVNNPLGIVSNYLKILQYKSLGEPEKEILGKIETQIRRISEITKSMLSFSRFNASGNETIDICELIDEVVLLMEYKLEQKNITLHKHFMCARSCIKGNTSRLRQVFLNILNNSTEAVDEGGIIEIYVDTTQGERAIEISINDNGYGIPQDIREEIFNPFFTTKLTKENAGLGLSVCQQIVKNHKGIITFTSRPNEYTSFQIQFPLV